MLTFERAVLAPLGGGKNSVSPQKCGDEGWVAAQEGGYQVFHQVIQSACLDGPYHAGLIPVHG